MIKTIEEYNEYKLTLEKLKKAKDFYNADIVNCFMKEYRMENNFYEINDKVVLLNWENNNRILTIKEVYEHKIFDINGNYSYSTFIYLIKEWSHERWFSKRDIRYATKEEIEVGSRL